MTKDQMIIRRRLNEISVDGAFLWMDLDGDYRAEICFNEHTKFDELYEHIEKIVFEVEQMSNEQKDEYIRLHKLSTPIDLNGMSQLHEPIGGGE